MLAALIRFKFLLVPFSSTIYYYPSIKQTYREFFVFGVRVAVWGVRGAG